MPTKTDNTPSLASTSGQTNLTKDRIAAIHGRFKRIRQVDPLYTPSNTSFLGPTRVDIPNRFSIGSAFFAVLATVIDRHTTLLRL